MKLIQAMKAIKLLMAKADDLKDKVSKHCADLSIETPAYPNQAAQVTEWMQSHHDTMKDILRLRVAIQRTNLMTPVAISLAGQTVTQSLAAWIHRRRDLANQEMLIWQALGDRGLRESNFQAVAGSPVTTEIRIRRYFDPVQRDNKLAEYRSEPMTIDGALEVMNATTDLIGALEVLNATTDLIES